MAKMLYDRANAPKTIHMIEGAHHDDFMDVGDGNVVLEIQSFISGAPKP